MAQTSANAIMLPAVSTGVIFSIADFIKRVTDPNNLIAATDFVGEAAGLALRIGGPALPIAQFAAGFIPGLLPALTVLTIALPYLQKIAAAAPLVHNGIVQAEPIAAAIRAASPDLVQTLRELFAVTLNADPAKPETGLTADDVSAEDAIFFATKSFFERSFFLPQDPRFARATENMG